MMKRPEVVLIYAPSAKFFWNYPPQGMARIVAFLKSKKVKVRQINLDAAIFYHNLTKKEKIGLNIFNDSNRIFAYLSGNQDYELEFVLEKILKLEKIGNPSIIGFSVDFEERFNTSLCLAKKLKEKTGAKIVFGGNHSMFCTEYIMKRLFFIDYVVKGEGEYAMLKLVKNNLDAPGLVYRVNSGYEENKMEYTDLDKFPVPDFDLSDYKKINNMLSDDDKKKFGITIPITIPYQVSKGCNGRCLFCNYSTFESVFLKSPKKIVDDIKKLVNKYGVKDFYLSCNCINLSKNHLIEICREIKKEKLKIKWECFARPKNLDFNTLKLMKGTGCRVIEYGVESGSQRMIEYLRKDYDLNEVERILENTKKLGIDVKAGFIINLPTETSDDIKQSANFIKRNAKNIWVFVMHRFVLVQGSYYYNNLNNLSKKEIEGIKKRKLKIYNENEIKELFNILKKNNAYVIFANFENKSLVKGRFEAKFDEFF